MSVGIRLIAFEIATSPYFDIGFNRSKFLVKDFVENYHLQVLDFIFGYAGCNYVPLKLAEKNHIQTIVCKFSKMLFFEK